MSVNRKTIIGSEADAREIHGALPWLVTEAPPPYRYRVPWLRILAEAGLVAVVCGLVIIALVTLGA